jgi:hypothetical protein
MTILEQARKYRAVIETAMGLTDDKLASEAPVLFPSLKEDGSLVPVGTRINWNGVCKKAATDLWDTVENNPDNAPALWADLNYKDGYRYIDEVLTVTTAFAKDECGWWNDVLYRSLVDGNVYNPEQYSANWAVVE